MKKSNFKELLIEFEGDKSYFSDYDYLKLNDLKDEVLVRFFRIEDEASEEFKSILIANDAGEVLNRADLPDEFLTNIAMVIKTTSDNYKAGDLVVFPHNKVVGEYYTNEYLSVLQASGGNMEPVLPEGFKVSAPRLELSYGDLMVALPENRTTSKEDKLTYLIPTREVQYGFKF